MLSDKESGALRDMRLHIDMAEGFARNQSFESLREDLRSIYAIIRFLKIDRTSRYSIQTQTAIGGPDHEI